MTTALSSVWLRYVGFVLVGSSVALANANCSGGGERPPAETEIPTGSSSGVATGDKLVITPLSDQGISFGENGMVNCGSQATAQEITLTNPTGQIINFTAKLIAGPDLFKLNPEKGGVQPRGGKATITVTPNPIPQDSEVTPDLYAATLEITNDIQRQVNDPPTVIRLHQTARGTIITSTVGTADIDFGDVRIGKGGSQLFTLTNVGNVPTTTSFTLGSQVFRIDNQQSVVAPLEAGKPLSKNVTLLPTAVSAYTDTIAIAYSGGAAHCKKPVEQIKVKGKGATSVAVSPGTVNFGNVACGSTAPPQLITIESSLDCKFTPQLGKAAGSPYLLQDVNGVPLSLGVEIPLANNTLYTMKIVPKSVDRGVDTTTNFLGDELTITTNLPTPSVDVPHKVTLTQTPLGGIFQLTPGSLMASNNMAGSAVTAPFMLKNVGNQATNYTITTNPTTNFTSTLATGTAAVGDLAGTATLIIPGSGQVNGTLSITSTGILCKDLPGAITLQATKTN